MIQKRNLGFPIHYVDMPSNEGNRLSDKVITMVRTKKFRNICSALLSAMLIIGRQGHAIPPEAGEHIANAADAAVNAGQVADLALNIEGRVVGNMANAPDRLPLPKRNPIPPAPRLPDYPRGLPAPGQPPAYMPWGLPITPVARTTNTILFTGSLAWICVNAYWGSPIGLAGCSIMFATWFANVLASSLGKEMMC